MLLSQAAQLVLTDGVAECEEQIQGGLIDFIVGLGPQMDVRAVAWPEFVQQNGLAKLLVRLKVLLLIYVTSTAYGK